MKNIFLDRYGELRFTWIMIIIGIVMGALIIPPSIIQTCYQATIFNKINGTSYTCADFFWAGDQINSGTQTIRLTK